MTVKTAAPAGSRVHPVAGHAYRLPVVRELPPLPLEGRNSRTW
jgi:hypothetical protein